ERGHSCPQQAPHGNVFRPVSKPLDPSNIEGCGGQEYPRSDLVAVPRYAAPAAALSSILDDLDPAVQGLPDEHENARMAQKERQPFQNLLWRPPLEEVEEVLVGLLHALFQLLRRHFGWLEHRVGPPILVPVLQQEAPLALQLVVDRSARIGRQNVEQSVFQPHLLDMGLRGLEDPSVLVVEAENEEPLHQNAMLMKTPHDLLVTLDLVLHHAGPLQ